MSTITFQWASPSDSAALIALVNNAYRGQTSRSGWTTEADLLEGLRIDAEELQCMFANPNARILMALQDQQLVGCILLEHQHPQVQLGMLAVNPKLQTLGIGSSLLQQAEREALALWQVQQIALWVIPSRQELIDYYQRRGYRPSNILRPFPENSRLWSPKVSGLELRQWVKDI